MMGLSEKVFDFDSGLSWGRRVCQECVSVFGARSRAVTAGKGALLRSEVADILCFFFLSGGLLYRPAGTLLTASIKDSD